MKELFFIFIGYGVGGSVIDSCVAGGPFCIQAGVVAITGRRTRTKVYLMCESCQIKVFISSEVSKAYFFGKRETSK